MACKYGEWNRDQDEALLNILGGQAVAEKIIARKVRVTIEELEETLLESRSFLKLISGAKTLELAETDGKATIANAKDTFPGGIYGLAGDRNVSSQATEKTQVSVHEMIRDGTFAQIWNGLSDDLNSLCLTQSQIVQFVQKHRQWLRTNGYATFFLFKVRDEFFVAFVYVRGAGRLGVLVYRFSFDYVWGAGSRHRVVVPCLPAGTAQLISVTA